MRSSNVAYFTHNTGRGGFLDSVADIAEDQVLVIQVNVSPDIVGLIALASRMVVVVTKVSGVTTGSG